MMNAAMFVTNVTFKKICYTFEFRRSLLGYFQLCLWPVDPDAL